VIRPVVAALVPSAGSAKIGAWHKRLYNPPILSVSNSGVAAPSLFKLGFFTSDLTGHGIPRVFYQANKMLGRLFRLHAKQRSRRRVEPEPQTEWQSAKMPRLQGSDCKQCRSFYRDRLMRWQVGMIIAWAMAMAPPAFAGNDHGVSSTVSEEPPRFDFALETAYLFGAINPPADYRISANFLTARIRWGDYLDRRGFFRGYNQVYLSFLAEPIIRGIENHYFGMNLGLRYNFVRPGSRIVPYFSGGLGLGLIDSQPERFGGQGQDFTFNVLSAAGLSYQFSDRFSGQLGVLYQHFSNAGQTDPNPSLNLFGPQIGFTFSF
jgi:hypothetical protein